MTTVVGTNATVLPRTSASNGTAHWVNEYGSPDAHYWLRGAMLAEISALCHTLAAVLLRKQAHKELRRVEEEQEHQEQRSSDVWGGGPVRRRTPTVDHAAVAAVVSRQRSIEPLSSHSVGTRLALVRSGKFWASVLLRALASCMWWFAHCYAKNATIAPVFFSVSLLTGLVSSPSILHEQFRTAEFIATVLFIIGGAISTLWDPDSPLAEKTVVDFE